jgi:excisionase family DNA binding protein
LTVQEAAERVRLTQWAIYRAIQRGEITAYKPGGRLRIHEADLEAWLESTRVRAGTPPATRAVRVMPTAPLDGAARARTAGDSLRARVRARRGKQAAA